MTVLCVPSSGLDCLVYGLDCLISAVLPPDAPGQLNQHPLLCVATLRGGGVLLDCLKSGLDCPIVLYLALTVLHLAVTFLNLALTVLHLALTVLYAPGQLRQHPLLCVATLP